MENYWQRVGRASEYINKEGLELREYQFNIITSILKQVNTLVVLPTGLGKTMIGAVVAADALSKSKKALFLAPTKPLAEQHEKSLAKLLRLRPEEILLLVGSVNKQKRTDLINTAKIVIATPQTMANEMKDGMGITEFGCVIFDECHRAVGRYAYTYIANECWLQGVLMVGLTASPGSKREKVKALIEELKIQNIEARATTDTDVARYVMGSTMQEVRVDLNESIKEISALLAPEGEASLRSLNKIGLLHFKNFDNIPKGLLIKAGTDISKIDATNYRYAAIFSYVKLLNIAHAYDLLRSEGFYPFSAYWDRLEKREKKSRGLENLLANPSIIKARELAKKAMERGEEHEKVFAVLDILRKQKSKSAILFVQYRSTIKMLVEFLVNNGFKARAFVGKKEGVTQEMQKTIISDFRERKFDVLVASSIAEEGLDIPSVDAVVFYEPIPSEIRNIQRRGRTGRFREGEVYILVAKGTKDEIYMHISRQKEQKMIDMVKSMGARLSKSPVVKPSVGEGQQML